MPFAFPSRTARLSITLQGSSVYSLCILEPLPDCLWQKMTRQHQIVTDNLERCSFSRWIIIPKKTMHTVPRGYRLWSVLPDSTSGQLRQSRFELIKDTHRSDLLNFGPGTSTDWAPAGFLSCLVPLCCHPFKLPLCPACLHAVARSCKA